MALVASAHGSAGNEEHLSDMLLPLDEAVRFRGVAHRERPGDGDLDLPVRDEAQRRPELVRRGHAKADDAPAVLEQPDHVDLDTLASVRAAGDESAVLA